MRVTVESLQDGITVIRPAEALEMNNVSAFRHTLQTEVQRADRGLVFLAEVTFIDSAGIAVLIEGLKWSRERGLPYVLSNYHLGADGHCAGPAGEFFYHCGESGRGDRSDLTDLLTVRGAASWRPR